MRSAVFAVVVVVMLGVGCASRPAPPAAAVPPGLGSITWTDRAADMTLAFRPGTVDIADDCSATRYRIALTRDRLRLGRMVAPGWACSGPPTPLPRDAGYVTYRRQQAAAALLEKVLADGAHWSVRGEVLTLRDTDGRVASLTSRGGAPLTLDGSRWTLRFISTLHGTGAGVRGPTLQFGPDGTFRATNSCDELAGTAAIGPRTITFHVRTHGEHRFCPHEQPLGTVATVDTMLDTTVTYRIVGNSLTLRSSHGREGVLSYSPAA